MDTRSATKGICKRARTTQERVLDGLQGKEPWPELEVCTIPGKGRGVFLRSPVQKGDFLLEYDFDCSYPRQELASREAEYAQNEEPCMVIEVQTSNGWVCLDATRCTEAIGRLCNHAPPWAATAKPHRVLLLNGVWRLGFVATRDLSIGEEVTWDYNCPPDGQVWLMKRAGKVSEQKPDSHPVQEIEEQEEDEEGVLLIEEQEEDEEGVILIEEQEEDKEEILQVVPATERRMTYCPHCDRHDVPVAIAHLHIPNCAWKKDTDEEGDDDSCPSELDTDAKDWLLEGEKEVIETTQKEDAISLSSEEEVITPVMRKFLTYSSESEDEGGQFSRKEEEVITPVMKKRKFLTYSSESEDEEVQISRKKQVPPPPPTPPRFPKGKGKKKVATDMRKYKFCPFPSCSRACKKLSQHLQALHPELSAAERAAMCSKAKCAPGKGARKPVKQPPQQATITALFEGATRKAKSKPLTQPPQHPATLSEGEKEDPLAECGTLGEDAEHSEEVQRSGVATDQRQSARTLDHFPLDQEFLVSLQEHLMSRHGRSRSAKEARQITREVSRYLYFADPTKLSAKLLLSPSALDRYLQSLEAGSASTQNATLCRIRQGIAYLQLSVTGEDLQQASKTMQVLSNWSSTLGKRARQANRTRLEELSEQPTSFAEVDQLVNCPALHRHYHNLLQATKQGRPVTLKDVRVVSIWLAGCLLHTNHQRPGAVVNAKLAEYQRGIVSTHGRLSYRTFKVQEHKTGTTGSAKLTTDKVLTPLLEDYVRHLRPLMPTSSLLFPNQTGKPIDHLSRYLQQLGKQHGLVLPTATQGRHAAATAITQTGKPDEMGAVAEMMSHSPQTQQRYYAQNKSTKEAVKGFQLMAGVRQGTSGSPLGQRSPFTEDEVEVIELYFSSFIESGEAPSSEACREFLRQHCIDRNFKQVRDKVRHLIRCRDEQ